MQVELAVIIPGISKVSNARRSLLSTYSADLDLCRTDLDLPEGLLLFYVGYFSVIFFSL
jgi:hypothetical protein